MFFACPDFSSTFFGFPRFFLTIIVVQNVFEKKTENVLRMPGFFPVLFLVLFPILFSDFPRFFLTIVVVQVVQVEVQVQWYK